MRKPMVPPEFLNYFITAASVGGALIGLLFVSISIAPQRTVLASAPIETRVMSSSAFLALLNGFGKDDIASAQSSWRGQAPAMLPGKMSCVERG